MGPICFESLRDLADGNRISSFVNGPSILYFNGSPFFFNLCDQHQDPLENIQRFEARDHHRALELLGYELIEVFTDDGAHMPRKHKAVDPEFLRFKKRPDDRRNLFLAVGEIKISSVFPARLLQGHCNWGRRGLKTYGKKDGFFVWVFSGNPQRIEGGIYDYLFLQPFLSENSMWTQEPSSCLQRSR
jgi:hypothetical protein